MLVALAASVACSIPARAVTDREMEQARVIAVQTYLRYANDGSGYLDDLHPTTMAQLEKSLRPIERENIKAAKGVGVPSDYAGWDKARLVEYWGTTFFNSPALSAKGKIGKSRARSRLQKLTVAPPAPKETPKPQEAAKPSAQSEAPAEAAEQAPAPVTATAEPVTAEDNLAPQSAGAESLYGANVAAQDSLVAEAEAALEDEPVRKRKDSTWIYVLILCVLVAVVVALVIFASSTMRNRGEDDETPEERSRSLRRMEEAHRADMEEQKRLAGDMEAELGRLADENSRLKADLDAERAATARLRAEHERVVADFQSRLASANAAASAAAEAARAAQAAAAAVPAPQTPVPAAAAPQAAPAPAPPAPPQERKIYLGRVNLKGLFVRADRTLNPEGSVYVMETDDGYSGSYRVVRNREVWNRLLEDPAHWLGNGCAITESEEGEPMAIVTERAGTTVFEDGCWRVIRKARIRLD